MGEAARRAVLIGTGRHRSGSDLPDLPSVSTTLDDLARALHDHCGFHPDAVTVLHDPGSPADIGDAIAAAASEASEVLLVYYVGHGILCADELLHLAAERTTNDPYAVQYNGLPYRVLAGQIRCSPARHRVVVLDCCFSGQALDAGAGLSEGVADQSAVTGGFVLTSTSRFLPAIAPEGARHTAFTGALLRLLDDGDREGPAEITLRHAHHYLSAELPRMGLPQPRCRADNASDDLVLAENPAFRPFFRTGERGPAAAATSLSCPYKGLDAFDVGDEQWFHGRSELTALLMRRLAERHHGTAGPLTVVGASGAGKSSILRAGLLPALGRGALAVTGPRRVFTPGRTPVSTLASQLSSCLDGCPREVAEMIRERPADLLPALRTALEAKKLVLVVDQFEEVFGADDVERDAFVRALLALASADLGGPACALVVVSVREDFYGRLTVDPVLSGLVVDTPVVIAAMSAREIREAITAPARRAGLEVAPELVDLLLEDLGVTEGRAAYEPGRLPLLSHAMRVTWQRHDGAMTVEAYRATGGLREALTRTAEAVLAQVPRDVARQLLLRLIRVGDRADHVRQMLPWDELVDGLPVEDCRRIVDLFTGERARLLSADADGVRITHEALIGTWPRLRGWVESDRAGLRARQRLIAAANEWRRHDESSDDLYRGHRLAAAREAAYLPGRDPLPPVALAFLEAAEAASRRRARRRAGAMAALAVVAVVAVAAAVTMSRLRADASASALNAREQATLLQAELLRAGDSKAAIVRATSVGPGPKARSSLVTTLLGSRLRGILRPPGGAAITSMDTSADGTLLAAADGTNLLVYDGSRPVASIPLSHGAQRVVFAPRGRILAVAGSEVDGQGNPGALWDLADPARPERLGAIGPLVWHRHANTITDFAFNRDATMLATARNGFGPAATLWDVRDPGRPNRVAETPRGFQGGTLWAVDFSPDGKLLATGSKDNSVALWRIDRGKPAYQSAWAGSPSDPMAIRFHPGGKMLMSGTLTSSVAYDVAVPGRIRPLPPLAGTNTSGVDELAISPDGRTMVMAGSSHTITVWDVSRPDAPVKLADLADQHTPVTALAFTADGRHFLSAGDDGSVLRWATADAAHPPEQVWSDARLKDVSTICFEAGMMLTEANDVVSLWRTTGAGPPVFHSSLPVEGLFQARLIPARSALVTTTLKTLSFWDVTRPGKPVPASAIAGAPSGRLEVSGDGTRVSVTSTDYARHAWNIADLHHPVGLPAAPVPREGSPIARSSDGRLALSTEYRTGTMRLSSPDHAAVALPLHSNGQLGIVHAAFSPDGSMLAVNDYGTIRVFDLSDPAVPVERAALTRPAVPIAKTVAFSADGNTLAAAGEDASISRWDLTDLRDAILHPEERASRVTR
ncbi:AAA family ATPase [Actinoplanes sp. NPDC049118]|uniref:caspase, EACC1-associated type n=1 Tax=Actinoplanes sp. NPDC049118 TaxID=3155769 RepID=UPI0033F4C157